MIAKITIPLFCALIMVNSCLGGLLPAVPAAYASVPYASSYSAHAINHAIAAPYAAAPLVAAPAIAQIAAYSALPAPYVYGK